MERLSHTGVVIKALKCMLHFLHVKESCTMSHPLSIVENCAASLVSFK